MSEILQELYYCEYISSYLHTDLCMPLSVVQVTSGDSDCNRTNQLLLVVFFRSRGIPKVFILD